MFYTTDNISEEIIVVSILSNFVILFFGTIIISVVLYGLFKKEWKAPLITAIDIRFISLVALFSISMSLVIYLSA